MKIRKVIDVFGELVFIAGVITMLSGLFHAPFFAAGSLIIFFWVWFVVICQLPPLLWETYREWKIKKKARKAEADRRRNIQLTTEPETFSVYLDNYHAQGMNETALVLVADDDTREILGLVHEDLLTVYNTDGTVLWRGEIDFSPANLFRKMFPGRPVNPTHKALDNQTWRGWFYHEPPLKAQLRRYRY